MSGEDKVSGGGGEVSGMLTTNDERSSHAAAVDIKSRRKNVLRLSL